MLKYLKPALAIFLVIAVLLFTDISTVVAQGHSSNLISIYDIQFTEDASGDSPYAGQVVTVSGIVTGIFFNGYTIAGDFGPWHAVFVFSNKNGPQIGDKVEVSGTISEYFGLTEIYNVIHYELLSSGNAIPPLIVDAKTVQKEKYESVLVKVKNVVVSNLEDLGEWIIQDGSGSIRCDDMNDYLYFPQIGDHLDSVTGILFYSWSNYKIEPRVTSNISGDMSLVLLSSYSNITSNWVIRKRNDS